MIIRLYETLYYLLYIVGKNKVDANIMFIRHIHLSFIQQFWGAEAHPSPRSYAYE